MIEGWRESDFQAYFENAIAEHGVTGASFAYWDGVTTHMNVMGVRNSVTGDPVTTDTIMAIGSITKVMTATLVMQLVDDGLIALEDPVLKHLPDLRLKDLQALERMTCAMLINHTSGIDGMMLPNQGPDQERIVDAIRRFAKLGQLHPPGEGPSYCNAGVVIAGYLVQQLRGESWYTVVRRRILEPLAMEHAIAELTDIPRFRTGVGDLTDPATGKRMQTSRPFLSLSFAPAGATMMMTATDLLNFGRAHMNGGTSPDGARILSANSAERMRRATASCVEPKEWRFGLGWFLRDDTIAFHPGGCPGMASILLCCAKTGRVAALITNSDTGHALNHAFADALVEHWTGLPQPAHRSDPAPVEGARYVGVYENVMFRADVVSLAEGIGISLTPKAKVLDNISLDQAPPVLLEPTGDHGFRVPATAPPLPVVGRDIRFAFPDKRGHMSAIGTNALLLVKPSHNA